MSQPLSQPVSEPTSDATAIHDLGYRRYDGAREGAGGVWRALYGQGVRAIFGLGRGAKSKILPVFVLLATLLPALAILAAASASAGMVPVRYGPIVSGQLILLLLFVAAQAPELVSRDQQHRVLSLIFTREVSRAAYGWARLASLTSGVFSLSLAPLLLLYIGEIGLAKDPAAQFSLTGGRIGSVLLQAGVTAVAMSGIGAALASFTPRRAYATAAIIAAFLVATAVATGLDDLAGVSVRTAELLDPIRSLRMLSLILFNEPTRAMELEPPSSVWVYVVALVALGGAGAAALQWRLRRVAA